MENPNRNFKSQTCEDFIEVLASKAAVPGGGGASALAGAIGIALGNMVGSLTVGKKTYADVEEEIIECKKQADEIAKEADFFCFGTNDLSLPKRKRLWKRR